MLTKNPGGVLPFGFVGKMIVTPAVGEGFGAAVIPVGAIVPTQDVPRHPKVGVTVGGAKVGAVVNKGVAEVDEMGVGAV